MRLFTIFLLSISLNIFANEKRQILFLTDSHGLSTFGEVVDASLRNIQDVEVTTWSIGGTAPWQWINPYTRWVSKLGYKDKGTSADIPKPRKGNKVRMKTPHIDEVLSSFSPGGQKIALIVQGTNHQHSDWGLNFLKNNSRTIAQKLIDAEFKCYWVGPPKMRRYMNRGANYTKKIIDHLKEGVGDLCEFYDSFPKTTYPTGGDGIHYSGTNKHKKAARKWASDLTQKFKTFFDLSSEVLFYWPNEDERINLSEMINHLKPLFLNQREDKILQYLESGFTPKQNKDVISLTVSKNLLDGKKHTLTYFVSSDYLSLEGSQKGEFLRTPLSWASSKKVLKMIDAMAPTKEMVDQIYRKSAVKIAPKIKSSGENITNVDSFVRHNDTVNSQLNGATTLLLGGHKKDIVISKKLLSMPENMAIYGWHQLNGKPIQLLSTAHSSNYMNYSHGLRLVSRKMKLNGEWIDAREILLHPILNKLISDEGAYDMNDLLDKI